MYFHLLQITDGQVLIQSIYDDQMVLKQCKVSKDETAVHNFIVKLKALSQTISDTDSAASDLDLSYRYNSSELIQTRQILEKSKRHLPSQLRSILDFKTAKLQCRNLGKILTETIKRRGTIGTNALKKAGDETRRRNRRDMLIFPGTLWCGVGTSAKDHKELGEEKDIDRCCRKHDFCPNYIERFTTRFGLFNHRLYTVSDCRCDDE